MFIRSTGRLDADRGRGRLLLVLVALALAAAWTLWAVAARTTVYAVSARARLETDQAPVPLEAPVHGRVVTSSLALGRAVVAGDELVALDVRAEGLRVREEDVKLRGLDTQVRQLTDEIASQERSRTAARAAATAAYAAARASYDEAAAAAELAADRETRALALAADGLIQPAELVRARSDVRQRRAAAEALRLTADRLLADDRQREAEHHVLMQRLQREVDARRSEHLAGRAALDRLHYERELRRILAPVSGTIAEAPELPLGRVLSAGDKVATIIPDGAVRIVASFAPADVFGRVREGQKAWLRLDGFPPLQYGPVEAAVTRVASEVRDGVVRVELRLVSSSPSVPMQHGLPGRVEVAVEQLSPVALLLRSAGLGLSRQAHSLAPVTP